ncbi:MAG: 6-phosphogluconolactonase [Rhizobiaceae bacterium]|nr:6-phosphogluconolactonase [Rhizobiaceae bacterium]
MTAPLRQRLKWNEFASPDDLAEGLARKIGQTLVQALAERGKATLAVSGGRTPKLLFEALSFAPIAWERVTIVLVDERFVPADSGRSNEKLVRDHLMRYRAGRASLVPLFRAGASVEQAAILGDAAIAALSLPLDVVVLGMGPDGHTASFFPDTPNLEALYENADGRAVLPVHAESAGEPRLTLSMQVLTNARLLAVHIESEERKAILMQAVADGTLPIARVLAEAVTAPQIYWAP